MCLRVDWGAHDMNLDWFLTPTAVTIAFFATVLGIPLALWGLFRTSRSVTKARRASEQTRRVLRTADLRSAIEVALQVEERIVRVDLGSRDSATEMLEHLNTWLAVQKAIHGLMQGQLGSRPEGRLWRKTPPPAKIWEETALNLESARADVLTARDDARDRRRWRKYDMRVLGRSLAAFGESARALLVTADDEVIRDA